MRLSAARPKDRVRLPRLPTADKANANGNRMLAQNNDELRERAFMAASWADTMAGSDMGRR